jgi:hypothetical protein
VLLALRPLQLAAHHPTKATGVGSWLHRLPAPGRRQNANLSQPAGFQRTFLDRLVWEVHCCVHYSSLRLAEHGMGPSGQHGKTTTTRIPTAAERRQPRHGKEKDKATQQFRGGCRVPKKGHRHVSPCLPRKRLPSRGGLEGSGGVAARRWYPALAFIPLGYGIPAVASWSESEHAFVRRREPCRLKTRWCWLCWYGVGK